MVIPTTAETSTGWSVATLFPGPTRRQANGSYQITSIVGIECWAASHTVAVADRPSHTFADIEPAEIGDDFFAAHYVRYLGYCVGISDIDLLGNLATAAHARRSIPAVEVERRLSAGKR
jgi:hypothetical protein